MTKAQQYGLLCFMSAMVGAKGVHWLITPHVDAALSRTWAVLAQVCVGFGCAVFAYRRSRQLQIAAQAGPESEQHVPNA